MKPVTEVKPPPRARGRPRSEQARNAILRAAHDILQNEGLTAVTVEAVAQRAGVGKPTIYRSWPNAQALAMAALMAGGAAAASDGERAPAGLVALRRQLRDIAATFATRMGRSVTMMLAAAEPDTELSKVFRHHFIMARREEGRAMLSTAIAKGEVASSTDIDVALDLIYAPIFYRLLVGHGPLDAAYADGVLDQVLRGLAGGRQPRPRPAGRQGRGGGR
jgi:AcrR family transcriptional regulator